MPKPIDLTKPTKTRGGLSVYDLEVYGGVISGRIGEHHPTIYWDRYGRQWTGRKSTLDLINAPEASDG